MSTPLDSRFNHEATRLQIQIITGEADPAVEWRLVPESAGLRTTLGKLPKEERARIRLKYRGPLSERVKFLRHKNSCGYAVFILPNQTDGRGAKKENVIAVRCLTLDLDGAPLPKQWEVEPHLIVATSPGRYQAFWAIEPTADFAACENLARRLAAHYGGDSSVSDISHVFRCAGFCHQKGKLFTSRIVSHVAPEDVSAADGFYRHLLGTFSFLPPIPERETSATTGGTINTDKAKLIFEHLKAEKFASDEANGDTAWRTLAMSLHDASGGDPDVCDLFMEFCRTDPEYDTDADEAMNRLRWESFRTDKGTRVTIGTLHKICRDHGVPDDAMYAVFTDASDEFDPVGSDSTEISRVESRGLKINKQNVAPDTYENALCAVVRSGLGPAWDDLKQNVIFRAEELPWQEHFGRVLNDHVLRMARLYLVNQYQGVAYSPSKDNLLEALMTCAYGAKFNPVLEYIASLSWDGTSRVEHLFSHYFNCGNYAYERAVSRCFMIGAVRRMCSPGSKFDTMPILRSPQGWEKSTAVRTLFGAKWYSDADLGNLHDKDSAMKLRGIWVQEFAEIDSLTRAETGAMKAFCSRATDRQRDPYGRVAEETPRRCVFIATVNEGGFLKDSTGGRRFWPLDVQDPIDVALIAADRDQLWAEAAVQEAQGASDVLPQDLWPVAARRQAEQTSDDPWGDTLAFFLNQRAARGDGDEGDDFPALPPDRVHTSELFNTLGIAAANQTKGQAQRLRTVMESVLKWHHRHNVRMLGRTGAGYIKEARSVARYSQGQS